MSWSQDWYVLEALSVYFVSAYSRVVNLRCLTLARQFTVNSKTQERLERQAVHGEFQNPRKLARQAVLGEFQNPRKITLISDCKHDAQLLRNYLLFLLCHFVPCSIHCWKLVLSHNICPTWEASPSQHRQSRLAYGIFTRMSLAAGHIVHSGGLQLF